MAALLRWRPSRICTTLAQLFIGTAADRRRAMRLIGAVALGLVALATVVLPVDAQNQSGPLLPDTAVCPKAIADLAICYSAKLETGAYVLAAMPRRWNGTLIVHAHGGPALVPPTAADNAPALASSFAVKLGYAWIGSSYRREGYGVQMATADTDDARKFFIERIAKPKRVILHGTSYGGLVGAKLLEKSTPNADGSLNYDGAFFNSGIVGGWVVNYEFRADLRAVYQYYCKNLPRPEEAQYPLWQGLPTDSSMTLKELATVVDDCTGVREPTRLRTALQAQNLANIVSVMRIPERLLVRHMQAATFVFRDMVARVTGGHSAFSNRSVHYRGSSDDAALNQGVARFDADPEAVAALNDDGQPTGALPVPVVSIHSLNDPQAAVEGQYEYRERVKAAGNGDRLVQAYTDEDGHGDQSMAEMVSAVDSLAHWIETGVKPTAQSIAAACQQWRATYDGPCRYHPEYEPKPYSTRFARGAAGP